MKVISKKIFFADKNFFLKEINSGKIFIYPTDTIYGIGCDAKNTKGVLKIREIKRRDEKPFSVIASGKEWILENCDIDKNNLWLNKLPGRYTLILKLINTGSICKEVNSGKETIGVRIPQNWFAEILGKSGIVFVTTSVNLAGEKPISSLSDLNEEIKNKVDYFIDDGILSGAPSTLVDLTNGEKIISRA